MSVLTIDIFLVRAYPLFLIKHCIVSADHWESNAGIFANVKYPAIVIHIGVKTGRHIVASKAKS